MTNRVREILEFTAMEPESAYDIEQMVAKCDPDELKLIEKIAGNLANGVRNVSARRRLNTQKSKL